MTANNPLFKGYRNERFFRIKDDGGDSMERITDVNIPVESKRTFPLNTQEHDDIATLLRMLADTATEPDYAEVERIAKRNGFAFDDGGELVTCSE